MNQRVLEKIEESERSDGYFITITRREGNTLKHWQINSEGFYYKDLLPSLTELRHLIEDTYPEIAYAE